MWPLFSIHLPASPLISFFFFCFPTEKRRTRCLCSVSSSAWPSASLMSAWPLWSCPPMFWGVSLSYSPPIPLFIWALLQRKAHLKRVDSRSFLPLSFLTGSYAFCLHRALLTGLTSNPHINDLHLDISGCEVRVPHLHMFKGLVQFKGTVSSPCGLCEVMSWCVSRRQPVKKRNYIFRMHRKRF